MRIGVAVLAAMSVAMSVAVAGAVPASIDPSLFQDLHWRLIGPFRGGREIGRAHV